ncbi:jerky protein homolog-like [Macrosteles quadrilineatus]|uniref:jerky protein homolog-like n=1 Tax=Macrosteles quadrilineatus TaxID=74068 RepID=UPI0023E3239D|nr:jerky protein homolog-like [Macrosteles quadrilineatus]
MEDKLNALKRLQAGESAKKIASEMGVGTSTVSDWKKSREKIEKWCSNQASSSGIKKCKMMKTAVNDKVNEALFLWFTQCRSKGLPVSGPILQEKALQFNKEIGSDPNFKASEGWLEKWKNRYGVRKLHISGEKLSANENAVGEFKMFLHKLLDEEGISGDQLYNCDESGLNFKMLPSCTLASKEENSAPGYKKKKERVTIMACSNVTGNNKLKLCMIGKSNKPRAFKNFKDQSTLPVWYRGQKSAWMNSAIFREWFNNQFVPSVEKFAEKNNLPKKAILLLDNAPSHPSADELTSGEIKCVFLPPNVTSLCQPMDQGVLETLKRLYRRKLLTIIIEGMDVGKSVSECLKDTDMLDVALWISSAWEELKRDLTLVKSWKKLLDHKVDQDYNKEVEKETENCNDKTGEEIVQLFRNVPGCDNIDSDAVSEWMKEDEIQEFTDNDIIDLVNADPAPDDDEEEEIQKTTMTHSEAFQAIEQLIEYVEKQEEATGADLLLFRRWRDITSKKRVNRAKQATITSFLSKT